MHSAVITPRAHVQQGVKWSGQVWICVFIHLRYTH